MIRQKIDKALHLQLFIHTCGKMFYIGGVDITGGSMGQDTDTPGHL